MSLAIGTNPRPRLDRRCVGTSLVRRKELRSVWEKNTLKRRPARRAPVPCWRLRFTKLEQLSDHVVVSDALSGPPTGEFLVDFEIHFNGRHVISPLSTLVL